MGERSVYKKGEKVDANEVYKNKQFIIIEELELDDHNGYTVTVLAPSINMCAIFVDVREVNIIRKVVD